MSAAETANPSFSVDRYIELGGCGMGMPVIRAWQALRLLPIGGVPCLSSEHT